MLMNNKVNVVNMELLMKSNNITKNGAQIP